MERDNVAGLQFAIQSPDAVRRISPPRIVGLVRPAEHLIAGGQSLYV
jgi:hypothetical protein